MKKRTVSKSSIDEIEAMPRISLIVHYERKMNNEKYVNNLLRTKADEIEQELLNTYTAQIAANLITKLRNTIKTVQYPAQEKSIGIFVSLVAEKVYYFTPSHLEDYTPPVF